MTCSLWQLVESGLEGGNTSRKLQVRRGGQGQSDGSRGGGHGPTQDVLRSWALWWIGGVGREESETIPMSSGRGEGGDCI